MAEYFQGKFKPNNPSKYKGNPNNIIYRSSWEFKFLRELDSDPNVIEYSSEELAIPYISPKDNRIHRYFPDMIVKKIVNDKVKTYMYEIKPKQQTKAPTKTKNKKRKTFISEAFTYAINQRKWEAAENYCISRGWEFKILTEDHLGIK